MGTESTYYIGINTYSTNPKFFLRNVSAPKLAEILVDHPTDKSPKDRVLVVQVLA